MWRWPVAAVVFVGCGSEPAPVGTAPSAPDVATRPATTTIAEVPAQAEPSWPSPGRLVVREEVRVPTGNIASLEYDLDVAASAGGYAVTLSGFRDPARGGKPTETLGLGAQPLLRSALASGHLQLDIGADGQLVGTPALQETLDSIASGAHRPGVAPEVAEVAHLAQDLIDTPVIRDAAVAHAADLWIPWSGLWRALGTRPALGATKVVGAFGLVFVVKAASMSATGGTVTLEAKTTRGARTENDRDGGRSWFIPSGPALPEPAEDLSFELVVRAELVAATSRPVAVTLEVTEHLEQRLGAPRTWRFDYHFRAH